MMNMDFWGLKNYSGPSFSNKCDCVKQMGRINAEVTITLILWLKRGQSTLILWVINGELSRQKNFEIPNERKGSFLRK